MSDPIQDGGPAFPVLTYQTGMSMRDAFAIAALQGIIASFSGCSMEKAVSMATINGLPFQDIAAKAAYKYADAMLAARKEGA